MHQTAGIIDAGFDGHITLELANIANLPITVYPGMRIAQLSFLTLTTPAEHPYGSGRLGCKYQGQAEPTPSRYHLNFEPMKVLVTGATGYVGARASSAGSRPTATRCGRSRARRAATSPTRRRRAGDGRASTPRSTWSRSSTASPEQFERVVVGGARNVVAAARAAGVRRLLHMSALGVTAGARAAHGLLGRKWRAKQAVTGSDLRLDGVRAELRLQPAAAARSPSSSA